MKTAIFGIFFIIGCAGSAFLALQYVQFLEPTSREECLLKNSKGLQSDVAAQTIRVACERQFSGAEHRFQELPEPPVIGNIFDQFDRPNNEGTPIPETRFKLIDPGQNGTADN